jgi:hypothetical protein
MNGQCVVMRYNLILRYHWALVRIVVRIGMNIMSVYKEYCGCNNFSYVLYFNFLMFKYYKSIFPFLSPI